MCLAMNEDASCRPAIAVHQVRTVLDDRALEQERI